MRRGLVLPALLCLLVVIRVCDGKKSKRWTYPRPQWPVPEHRMDTNPCQLFLWDLQSAAKFCECSRLLKATAKTSLWEDGHRQLWLRIPYASSLLELFPCQQHSLSRCGRCGHGCWEHVRWAAQRRRNRPFEKLLLDRASHGIPDEAPLDYREVSVLFGPKTASARGMDADAHKNGPGNLGRAIAVVAEAQRTSTLQVAGISVTSAAARAAFKEVQDLKTAKVPKRKRKQHVKSGKTGLLRGSQ